MGILVRAERSQLRFYDIEVEEETNHLTSDKELASDIGFFLVGAVLEFKDVLLNEGSVRDRVQEEGVPETFKGLELREVLGHLVEC